MPSAVVDLAAFRSAKARRAPVTPRVCALVPIAELNALEDRLRALPRLVGSPEAFATESDALVGTVRELRMKGGPRSNGPKGVA